MKTIVERFEEKFMTDPNTGCFVWMASRNSAGYGHFGLNGSVVDAHRAAYEIYVGPIPSGKCVLHRCDNTSCVNPSHLFLGTQKENIRDMMSKGRKYVVPSGENSWASKLTRQQVLEIRKDTRTHRDIAQAYGIGKSTVGAIKIGQSWKTA